MFVFVSQIVTRTQYHESGVVIALYIPAAKPLCFNLTLTHIAPTAWKRYPASGVTIMSHLHFPSPSSPSLLSTPHRGHPATSEELISTAIIHTRPCGIIFAGDPCPCECGKFDPQPGPLDQRLCINCMHPFCYHDTPPDGLAIFEAPSVSPQYAPAQLARPTQRAQACLDSDFRDPSVPSEWRSDSFLCNFSFF